MSNNLEEARALTKRFTVKPNNEELLQLYGLYKQATEGDNKEDPPGAFDFIASAKYHSWEKYEGKPKEEAAQAYIDLVNELSKKYL